MKKSINKLKAAHANYTLSVQGGAESKKPDGTVSVNAVANIQIFDASKAEPGKPPFILKSVAVTGSGPTLEEAQNKATENAVTALGL